MRVVVTGGRYFTDRSAVYTFLDQIHQDFGVSVLIHGDATGADTLSKEWAEENKIEIDPFPVTKADWRRYGKRAGHLRNQEMIDQGKPDLLVAFPGHNGTADMKSRCRKAGLPVEEFAYTTGDSSCSHD